MSRKLLLKGGAWLSAGNALSAIFSFLRNIAIARLVSVGDFGVVVLLSMVVAVMETISNLAIDRLLVQAPDGDDPKLQAVAHALQVARGLVGALVMLASASLLAALFKVPQAAWAFQLVALTPAIRSLAHLDTVRVQREMRFGPTFWVVTLPSALSLAISLPLAYWLHDYSAVVWAILLQSLAQTAISHILADRPYRWAWEKATIGRILDFGWPLLVNGLLMFVIFQGDKAIVGIAFSPEIVGWYGAAFMLSMTPAMFITSVTQSLLLPILSRAQGKPEDFARLSDLTTEFCLATGLLVAVVFLVFGADLLVLLFGSRYQAGSDVVSLLGLAQGFRVAKAGPFISSVARGRTKDPLLANLARGASVIVAILLVLMGLGPLAVAGVGAVGELVSYLVASFLVSKCRPGFGKMRPNKLAMFILLLVGSYGVGSVLRARLSPYEYIALATAWLLFAMGTLTAASRSMRSALMQAARRNQGGRIS